jgi:ABC-type transport system substrate-binding protein
MVASLMADEVDVIIQIPHESLEKLTSEGYKVMEKEGLTFVYIALNNQIEPFNDVRVRQALNYAINKTAVIEAALGGHGTEPDSCLSSLMSGHYSVGEVYPYDQERAKDLLEEAGYTNGFESTLWTIDRPEARLMAQVVQAQLKEVGIDINIQTKEWGTLIGESIENYNETGLEMTYWHWMTATGDISGVLPWLVTTESWPTTYGGRGYNIGLYSNEEVDIFIQNASNTTSLSERDFYYAEAQKQIIEDAPWIFLYTQNAWVAMKPEIKGAIVYPFNYVGLGPAWEKIQ